MSAFEEYLKSVEIQKLVKKLGVSRIETITKEIKHFTEKEAKRRDEIVFNYFGRDGIKRIIEAIVKGLLSRPRLRDNAEVLDVGAGSGFFTTKVAKRLRRHLPEATFYAMDLTPAMLEVLARRTAEIAPFLGTAENIHGSVEQARKYLNIPKKFDAIFSTLMLHHCLNIERVFESFRKTLKVDGKTVVVDLCKHSFEEFGKKMGDLHLGFEPEVIKDDAEKHFSKVQVKTIQGIRCTDSGRSAELFVAVMIP